MTGNLLGALDSGMALLLVVLCLTMLSVSVLRRSRERTVTSRDLTREQRARQRDQHDLQFSMDALLVQLEEVSRKINAQVDTRFAKLEAVIRDADARIARLQALQGEGAPTEVVIIQTPDPQSPEKQPPARQHASAAERKQRIYELSDAGNTALTIADALSLPVGEVELILSLRQYR